MATGNAVSVIDTMTNAVIAVVPLGSEAGDVAVNPAGTRVMWPTPTSTLVLFRLSTRARTLSSPQYKSTAGPLGGSGVFELAVTPNGTRVYATAAAGRFGGEIVVIDTATNTVVRRIPRTGFPIGVTVSPDGSRVYVAGGIGFSVIDSATDTVVAQIPLVEGFPQGLAVNPAGTRVFVAIAGNNAVSLIDTTNYLVAATVPVESNLTAVAVNPTGTRVYVTNFLSGTVSVIEASANKVIATVPVGSRPNRVSIDQLPAAPSLAVTLGLDRETVRAWAIL